MRIAQTQSAIPALAPEKRVEAVKVRPAIDAGLRDCLKQNPSGVPLGGALGRVGANGGFSLGSPVLVDPNIKFLPLFNPNSVVDLMSAVRAAAESPSPGQLNEVVDKAIEFAEQLPENATVHVIGLVRLTARAVSALKKPGPKNKVEVGRAVVQCLAALVRSIADLPGLESAKPYTDGFYLVLKVGEEILVVPHTEVIRGSSGAAVTTRFSP
jgi:hypothetical protein